MKLHRIGANRKERNAVLINVESTRPQWNAMNKVVQIKVQNQTDPSLKGEYDYTIEFTLSDVIEIITVLSESGIKTTSETLEQALSASSLPLLRLLVLSSGLAQKPEERSFRLNLEKFRERTL